MDIWAEIKTGKHWTDQQGLIHEKVDKCFLAKVSQDGEINMAAKKELISIIEKQLTERS